jgi:hypothetical protein
VGAVLTLDQKLRWRELILSELYDRTGCDPLNGLTPSEILEGGYGRLGYPFAPELESEVVESIKEEPESETAERLREVQASIENVREELGEATGPDVDQQIRYLKGEGLLRWEGNQIVLTHDGFRHVEERAGGGEAAAVLPAVVVRDVEAFLGEVQRKRDDLGLAADDEQALEANVQSLVAQLKSPKPNRGVVRATVGAIGWLAKNAAAGAVGTALFAGATQLLGKF